MKYLDKLINFIFSLAILVISAIVVLVATGFLEYELVDSFIRNNIFNAENNTITCISAIIVFLASLKTTVFLSKTTSKKKTAIMVDTTNGKIQIASDTIESTAKNVAKSYDEVKDVQVKMVKEKRAVNIYMVLLVLPHTNIIELSSKVQDEVKNAIQTTTGIKVNNIDIKIKNIADNKNKSQKAVVKEETVVNKLNVEEKKVEEKVNVEQETNESIPEQIEIEEISEESKENINE